MFDPSGDFQTLGLSLLLGLLVGLQREVTKTEFAGLRTFALVAVFGTVCGLLAEHYGGWVLAAGVGGVVAVLLLGNLPKLATARPETPVQGTTTEVALLLMFGIGAYLVPGRWEVGVAVGAGLAVVLQFKPELHGAARRLGGDDLKAIMQFVLITFVILPVLPDRTYGPLDVFNPHEVWLMVTLIVGLSLAGYLLYKFLGDNAGVLVGGLLGGAISSTATTLAYARRVHGDPQGVRPAALVVAIACAVVFVRVLVEIGAVAPGLLPLAVLPMTIGLVLSLAPVGLLWWWARHRSQDLPAQKNPTELGAAVTLAAIYTVILFVLAAARTYLGEEALYLVAVVSGLTDVDAIALSVSRMAGRGDIPMDMAWRLILTAILSNLLFKAGIAGVVGGPRLLGYLALLFALPLLGGAALVWLWPQAWAPVG